LTDDSKDALLREIRDLLVPIADHYRPEYEARQAEQRAALKKTVAAMVSSGRRRAAWDLADGKRSQREISQQSGLDEGATSKLFKTLRELGVVTGTNPKRTIEIE
jgi:hypothetical protein